MRLLSDLYHAQANNFKTLFDFADGAQTYRNFQDREHFIHGYPFIPYQFALFQSAIQNLSQHNAFEGRHSSVGERSMLGVFQQVAIQIGNYDIGQLATFDLMFEGIRTALKSHIQRAIIQAETHLDAPFAIRLLKTLFLVKYVKEFKPTIRNLCVLMLDGFNQDLPVLKKRVEEALSLLEQQIYVQRHGDLYAYLTDEEKDVEQEIKNTEVESAEVAAELEKLVFDHVIKQRKLRCDPTDQKAGGQDYPFSRKLDDRLHGREYELAIHVITPFHEHFERESILRMQSMGRDELLVLLPADERLVRDMLLYKRTEKYLRQTISITQQEAVKRILTDKGFQNRERHADLQQRLQGLLGKAKLIVAGADIETGATEAQTRVVRGFQELVARAYPNLRMLRGIAYSENDIAHCLQQSQQGLFGNDVTSLAESEQELLAVIQGNNRGGVRTTLKSLLEKFERKPYGWSYAAVLCTLANLCARSKVEVRADGNLLEENALERALRNTHAHANLVLEPQVEFTASQVRALKTFFEDFFDAPPSASEAKTLGKETGAALQELAQQLAPLVAQTVQYPFLQALTPVLEKLRELTGKPYTWYLTELTHQEDVLLDLKEGVIDPIRNFMSGPQKSIFDQARDFVQTQEPNFAYLGDALGPEKPSPAALMAVLTDPACFKGNRMQQVKTQVEALQAQVSARMAAEIASARERVAALQDRLRGMAEFSALTEEQQGTITRAFSDLGTTIEHQKLIAVIRDTLRCFEESDYQRLLAQMTAWAQPAPKLRSAPDRDALITPAGGEGPRARTQPDPRIEYVPSRTLKVPFAKAWLADEADVDEYLNVMREALLREIRQGKRIQI